VSARAGLIGHRGAAAQAPENTLAGFRKAAALGFARVEFDVRLSRDRRVILLHDETLERTSDGKGEARALDFAEIRRADAGGWFAPEFAGERVPALEEALDLLERLGLAAVIELKPASSAEALTTRAALAVLAKARPSLPPILSSFKPEALMEAGRLAPEFDRALLVDEIPRDWRAIMDRLGCTMLHAHEARLDRETIGRVMAEDVPLFAYTVNDPARARKLFEWGVAAIFTDAAPGMLEI